jgi:hypothetical protein
VTRSSKLTLALAAAVLAFAVVAGTALGASPHFKKGGTPTCTVSNSGGSSTTVCKGVLAGLGNGDVLIETTVSGSAVYKCQNNGGNQPSGQNKVLVGPSTTPTLIPSGEIKNGNLTFTTNPAVLSAPATVSGQQAGCPGSNWTGVNPQLTLTNITMTIAQGGTTLFTCSASDPNGLSGRVPLSC